jgi:hypothetical protein
MSGDIRRAALVEARHECPRLPLTSWNSFRQTRSATCTANARSATGPWSVRSPATAKSAASSIYRSVLDTTFVGDSSGRTRIEQDGEERYALEARALRYVPSAQNRKKCVAQDNMLVSISGDTVVAGGWAPLAPLQPAPRRGRRTRRRPLGRHRVDHVGHAQGRLGGDAGCWQALFDSTRREHPRAGGPEDSPPVRLLGCGGGRETGGPAPVAIGLLCVVRRHDLVSDLRR